MVEGETKGCHIKVVVVGEGAVGKTCMVMTYGKDEFPSTYSPTVVDTYETVTKIDNKEVNLEIWDTAGQADLGRVRPIAYQGANCFLVCFDSANK